MRFRHDQLAKQLVSALLRAFGETTTSVEVLADAQQIDIWHLPAEGAPDRSRLGLLGRMTASACLLEAYHEPPDDDELRACLRKQLAFHHARQHKVRGAAGDRPVVALATCWIVSSGRPAALSAFGFVRAVGWPRGVYDAPSWLGLKLAVLTELPRSRDTLLVRLLGRGAVLRGALREVLALEPGSWERSAVLPVFARLRFELPQDPHDSTAEEKELAMTSQEMLEAFQREALEQGIEQGMTQGAAGTLAHQFERRLGRALRADERALVRERTERLGPDRLSDLVLDLSADELAAWLADPNAR